MELPLSVPEQVVERSEEDLWVRDGDQRRVPARLNGVESHHGEALEGGLTGQLVGKTVGEDAKVLV